MDKTKAIINFLFTCDYIHNNPLFFNFGEAEANNKQLVTHANDIRVNTPFIDGSVRKRYTFTIVDYKSIAYRAIVNREGVSDENLENALDVQQIIDWITEQAEDHNYPNFGDDCHIEDMVATTDQPNMNGVDRAVTPALAKYSVSIRIDYIDYSKTIWK